jgi:integrase
LIEAASILVMQKEARRLSKKTLESTQGQINALVKFFGDIPLRDITFASFIAYQTDRAKVACASTVNHECALLKKMLKKTTYTHLDGSRRTLWEPIEENYSPLPADEWKPPKTFTKQEQERIFDQAAADPNLELAHIVFTITRNTTASGIELRNLRLRHLELDSDPPRVHIPIGKNFVRPRTIPLNEPALAAFELAVARCAKLGSHLPEHFLFPFRLNRGYWNANKPASTSWLRKQSERLRKATGIDHLRPHAFRHLAVTELLESGAPEQTVVALAGWIGRRMLETYSHTRIEAKNDAVNLLNQPRPPAPVPEAPAPAAPLNMAEMMQRPEFQEEIQRQMRIAMQGSQLAPVTPGTPPGPRLLSFPRKGGC